MEGDFRALKPNRGSFVDRLDSLRAAISGGPGEFLKMYGRVAAADTLLKPVPAALSGG